MAGITKTTSLLFAGGGSGSVAPAKLTAQPYVPSVLCGASSGYVDGGGAPPPAPDAGIQPAGNVLLTRPDTAPATVEALTRELHATLSRMKPTGVNGERIEFRPACLVDDESVSCDILVDSYGEVEGQLVRLPQPRISGVRVSSTSAYAVFLHPAERTDVRYGLGTEGFAFATRVLAALRQRIDTPDPDAEWFLREWKVEQHNRNDRIDVPLSVLHPDKYKDATARIRAIEERSSALEPLTIMKHADFVRLVAQLVRVSYPQYKLVTGNETSWGELREHEGIYASAIDTYYVPNELVDGVPHIDLRKTARSPRVDHGCDPIRNEFYFQLVLDKPTDTVRFTVSMEGINPHTIKNLLRLYQVIVDAGYPVVIDEQVKKIGLGIDTEMVARTDPRLPADGGYVLTAETVEIATPLPPDAPPSLPPLE